MSDSPKGAQASAIAAQEITVLKWLWRECLRLRRWNALWKREAKRKHRWFKDENHGSKWQHDDRVKWAERAIAAERKARTCAVCGEEFTGDDMAVYSALGFRCCECDMGIVVAALRREKEEERGKEAKA